MLQARLPKEKRTVRSKRGLHGPASPILTRGPCIRVGGIFAVGGSAVALEGAGIKFGTTHVLVAVAVAAILIGASAIVGDNE